MQRLNQIYRPIFGELKEVCNLIRASFKNSGNASIAELGDFLMASPGKRIRPALVILSAKIARSRYSPATEKQLVKVASATELIHMASLLHDDVIDHSRIRHNKPTINSKRGRDVAIAFGDYLYSMAFELISECGNPDIVRCMSLATKEMCEGELTQVCERDNLDLLKRQYLIIIKKKTAALFAASCQAGGLLFSAQKPLQKALKGYGLHFGIAFQIIDDYMDLSGEQVVLGKMPGQDLEAGEMTLPFLNLLNSVTVRERAKRTEGRCVPYGKGLKAPARRIRPSRKCCLMQAWRNVIYAALMNRLLKSV